MEELQNDTLKKEPVWISIVEWAIIYALIIFSIEYFVIELLSERGENWFRTTQKYAPLLIFIFAGLEIRDKKKKWENRVLVRFL